LTFTTKRDISGVVTTDIAENTKSKKRDETAARIIKAIKEADGLLTMAAKKAGVCYDTVWRYTQDYPSVKQAVQEAKEATLDFAESKLYENMRAGDNACIIFYLKTQGKSRGFVERQEVEHSGSIGVKPEELTDSELTAIVQGNGRRGTVKAPVSPQSAN
jgi:hypothetical protein